MLRFILNKRILNLLLTFISLSSSSYARNDSYRDTTTDVPSEYDYHYPEEASVCEPGNICVRKCCPEGTLLSIYYECIEELPGISAWKPPVGIKTNFTVLYGIPVGGVDDICTEIKKENYEFNNDNGKIFFKEREEELDDSLYCIENTYNEKTIEVKESAVICYPILRKNVFDEWTDIFHKAGLSISSICLAIILMLYATSPLKNELKIQSKCIISSCFNLLIAFLLVLINMTKHVTENISQIPCVILAISMQFFFLSFYFWLNAMIYDISRIIRGTMKLQRMSSLERNRLRYIFYASYAWGCPAVISIVTIIMQIQANNLSDVVIKPHIGEGRCWFKEDGGSIYAYYYGIEVFLHVVNAGLIIYSLFLLKGQKLVQILSPSKGDKIDRYTMRSHASKNHFDMFWQQFCTYILYICVWIMNSVTLIHSREKFWRFIDIAVSLQGLFLLVIVVKFGNNMFKNAWEKLKEATKSLTTSTSTFDLTELSSQNQSSDPNLNEQKYHHISAR